MDPAGIRGDIVLQDGHLTINGADGPRRVSFRALTGGELMTPADYAVENRSFPSGYAVHEEVWADYDYDREQYVLAAPGRYVVGAVATAFVTAGTSPRRLELQSGTVTVNVTPEDRDAGRMWRLASGPALLSVRLDPLREAAVAGPYAPYARFALASEDRLPDKERVALLRRLLENNPPAQLIDLALLRLAELLRGVDDEASRGYAARVLQVPTAPPWRKREAEDLMR